MPNSMVKGENGKFQQNKKKNYIVVNRKREKERYRERDLEEA